MRGESGQRTRGASCRHNYLREERRRRLVTHLACMLSPARPFDLALEEEYARFKYASIHLAHFWTCVAVSTLTLSFAVLWRADIGLAGTASSAYWRAY